MAGSSLMILRYRIKNYSDAVSPRSRRTINRFANESDYLFAGCRHRAWVRE
jgi:hypothetical protein